MTRSMFAQRRRDLALGCRRPARAAAPTARWLCAIRPLIVARCRSTSSSSSDADAHEPRELPPCCRRARPTTCSVPANSACSACVAAGDGPAQVGEPLHRPAYVRCRAANVSATVSQRRGRAASVSISSTVSLRSLTACTTSYAGVGALESGSRRPARRRRAGSQLEVLAAEEVAHLDRRARCRSPSVDRVRPARPPPGSGRRRSSTSVTRPTAIPATSTRSPSARPAGVGEVGGDLAAARAAARASASSRCTPSSSSAHDQRRRSRQPGRGCRCCRRGHDWPSRLAPLRGVVQRDALSSRARPARGTRCRRRGA